MCLRKQNLVGYWVFGFFTHINNVLVLQKYSCEKNNSRGKKYHSLHPNLLLPCFNWFCWLLIAFLSPGMCRLLHFFIIFWFEDVSIGWNFSSSVIMNPLLCVTSSAIQFIPLHNNTHPIISYGDWEGDTTVIIALGGSCGDISTIIDRSMKQQCKW